MENDLFSNIFQICFFMYLKMYLLTGLRDMINKKCTVDVCGQIQIVDFLPVFSKNTTNNLQISGSFFQNIDTLIVLQFWNDQGSFLLANNFLFRRKIYK